MPKRKGENLTALRKLRMRRQFPLIRQSYELGNSLAKVARVFKLGEDMIYRAFKKAGVVMRPRGGSHRRVDTCHCGRPSMPIGSLCARHDRIRKSAVALRWYYRRKASGAVKSINPEDSQQVQVTGD